MGSGRFDFGESPWGYDVSDLIRGPDSPRVLDSVERSLWLDLWHAPVLDAIVEDRVESRWYGPMQATVVRALPETQLVNLLLGAGEPRAVSDGHLAEALGWIESLGLDCRVPVDPEREEAAAAEEVLRHWGYERAESQVRLLRDPSPPDFPAPAGLEVIEIDEFTEGFGEFFTEGFELRPSTSWLFDCLPGRDGWRCYVALDEKERPVAGAAMGIQWSLAAHLGFAATAEDACGRGCHMALIHRCIVDGAKDCPVLMAETIEPLGEHDGPSPACRNFLRAGFRQASVRSVWRRPGVLAVPD